MINRKLIKLVLFTSTVKKRQFKYYPEDFGALTVKVLHMDLDFDVYSDHSRVKSALKVKALKGINTLELNAKNLEIHSISSSVGDVSYTYENDIISLKFASVKKGVEFTVYTETTCKPTKNILEGMYYDETPRGAPPTIITQCQQWGFQRIVPCIDDMTAKCTYITTITADSRYTNIISNGDLKSTKKKGGRTTVVYDNTITPMSTYVFFLGCGTYATFSREFEYPDGKKFMLELLVPPKSKKKIAEHALEIMHDSIMWIYLFTGPDKYKNLKIASELWELVKDFGKNRKRIRSLAKGVTWGYKYTGTAYREIGMQNSDFGGMENVGNTTITTNRIMPFDDITDGSFEYMIDVKVHEFYHNLNGSEVTGRSPFEIWLNEAVTVHIEREFLSFLSGSEYARLGEVLRILAPGSGTLAMDNSLGSMPIEPDGFNDCNELITSVTYVKAPEFVRMVETLLGREKFVKGLDKYHTSFKHGNASRLDWIKAMERVGKVDLQKMSSVWLKKTGFPVVKVKKSYDGSDFYLKVNQVNGEWQFPLSVALFDSDGKKLASRTEFITDSRQEMCFEKVGKPAFVSVNRGYSFFGKVRNFATRKELFLQVRLDDDIVGRYLAFYQLFNEEKERLLKGGDVDPALVDLYYEMLNDEHLMGEVSSQFLAIFESVEDEKFAHHYDKLYSVKKKISLAIATKYKNELIHLYNVYYKKKAVGNYVEKTLQEIKIRQVKNLCLGLLSKLDTADVRKLVKLQYQNSTTATDKNVALALYLDSSAKDKVKILKDAEASVKSLVAWESFLYIVGRNDSADYLKIIKRMEKSSKFRIEQANDQRGLYLSFAGNRKKSLLTKEGLSFLQEKIIQLASINEYTTGHLLKVLGSVDKMEPKHSKRVVRMMKDVLKSLDKEKCPSVYNTLSRMLDGVK